MRRVKKVKPAFDRDRISALLIALLVVLLLLLGGVIVADRSLSRSLDRQAAIDASTSATIVAQEVELSGEWLHELSVLSRGSREPGRLADLAKKMDRLREFRSIWLFDSTGTVAIDSVVLGPDAIGTAGRMQIGSVAREAGVEHQIVLQALKTNRHDEEELALLAEPIIDTGSFASIAIAVVEKRALLAPAAAAKVTGRTLLALVANGDTIADQAYLGTRHGKKHAVQVPLPGRDSWFVVAAQAAGDGSAGWRIGASALIAVGLLSIALLRERGQTRRIAERSAELERLSAELLRANRMKSEFLANVSHELRTPLNAIVGFVDLLREGAYGELSDKQISPVQRIADSTARLRLLVDQVLDAAKITAGRVDVRVEAIWLRPFLTNLLAEIEPIVDHNDIQVAISVPSSFPKVRTDPTHLRQVLVNLIGNAVKYTERGRVEIRARLDDIGPGTKSLAATGQHVASRGDGYRNWIAIEIADTGIGIAAEDQGRIFEEFEQVRNKSGEARKNRGTGLGLPISRRLAELLGGGITVESELGKGSTFTVWLPSREPVA